MRRRRLPEFPAFDRAIELYGSENRLAAAVGRAQQVVNRARRRGSCSAELAIAIQRATGGLVTADTLRPELWRRAADVPVERKQSPPNRPKRIKRKRKRRRSNGG